MTIKNKKHQYLKINLVFKYWYLFIVLLFQIGKESYNETNK